MQERWNFDVYDFLSWRLDGVNGANREQRAYGTVSEDLHVPYVPWPACQPPAPDRACCTLAASQGVQDFHPGMS